MMPRPRHSQGRPNAVVLPPDWDATHAAVIQRTLDCTVTIRPSGAAPAWNDERGQTESTPSAPSYAGAASVTPATTTDGEQTTNAQDVIPTRAYEVKLPHPATGVAVGHVITIDAAPDPALVGQQMNVTAVEMASRRFSRVLYAVDAD